MGCVNPASGIHLAASWRVHETCHCLLSHLFTGCDLEALTFTRSADSLTFDSAIGEDGEAESVPVEEALERARVGEGPPVHEEHGLLAPGLSFSDVVRLHNFQKLYPS